MKEKIFEFIDEMGFLDESTEYYYNYILSYLDNYLNLAKEYFNRLPESIRVLIYLILILSFLEAAISLGMAVYVNRSNFLYDDKNNLTYSYFFGTRKHLKESIKIEFFRRQKRIDWNRISITYWLNKLKSFESEYKALKFLVKIVCLPIAIVSTFERFFKRVFGFVLYKTVSLVEFICFELCKVVATILIPIVTVFYKSQHEAQNCVECYREFAKPVYICPSCKARHSNLKPGRFGIFFARCKCGEYIRILPKYQGENHFCCPNTGCNADVISGRNSQTSIAVFGGAKSGKSAWICSAYKILSTNKKSTFSYIFRGNSRTDAQSIDSFFGGGESPSNNSVKQYTLYETNKYKKSIESLTFFEIDPLTLTNSSFKTSPLFLSYLDGVVFVIDPLNERGANIKSRKQYVEQIEKYDPLDLFFDFSQLYSSLSGRKSKDLTEVPVAVVINKSDIKDVNERIGLRKIQYEYKRNPAEFNYSLLNAENVICRQYLIDIGLNELVTNLENVYNTVCYFSVSAMGHVFKRGPPFSPFGAISPICWILSKSRSKFNISLR